MLGRMIRTSYRVQISSFFSKELRMSDADVVSPVVDMGSRMSDADVTSPDVDYDGIVVKTFFDNAVRTALLIDNRFPTLADLADQPADFSKTFPETLRAARLYRSFRDKNIICDIENNQTKAKRSIERIRKSDLIVLDYHLDEMDTDPTASIEIIRDLADTPHFNIVALFTKEENLDDVWQVMGANLRGGWADHVIRFPAERFDHSRPEAA
jgi:CheY-like chemotaxis protein